MHDHNLTADRISHVRAYVHQAALDVLGPVRDPQTVHQAKFSMEFVLALSLFKDRPVSLRLGWRRWVADLLRVLADHHSLRLGFGALPGAFFGRGRFFLGALLLVRALEEDAALKSLLQEVRAAAIGAFLRDGLVVRCEVALLAL